MAQRISRKQIKQDEFLDAAADAGHWLERHWRELVKWGGAVAVIALLVVGWRAWTTHRTGRGSELLASGIEKYARAEEAGYANSADLEGALSSFREAKDLLGDEDGGRTARYYEGAVLFRLKRFDEARAALESIGPPRADLADTVGVMGQALLADVLLAEGQPDRALAVLTQLLDGKNAAVPRDQVLLDAARIELGSGAGEAARAHLQQLVDEFPRSPFVPEARRLLTP
jgi:tetratricopeptide (TPR) repeat protein